MLNLDESAAGAASQQERDREHRIRFGRLAMILVGPMFLAYAIHFYMSGLYLSSGLMTFGAVAIAGSLLLNRLRPDMTRNSALYYLLAFCILVPLILHDIDIVWWHGRLGYTVWFYLYPLLLVFLLGEKKGLFGFIAVTLICGVVLFVPWSSVKQVVDITNLKAQFIVSYLGVSAIAFVYERTRRATQDALYRERANLRRSEAELRQSNEELKEISEASKRLAIEARAASLAKSEFLANMSHELRTPLNHIIGFSELVSNEQIGPLNEDQREYMTDVLYSSRHLHSLIEDILDLSKVESGKVELSYSSFDIVDLCVRSTNMVSDLAMKKHIDLETVLPEQEVAIQADNRRLRQVVYNLLSNAVKFTPEGGKVILEGRVSADDSFIISIIDTGVGIAEENVDRIFKPFEQVDNALTKRQAGTGLGLPLTRTFIELHGGTVSVHSDGPGEGSAFTVKLPLNPV